MFYRMALLNQKFDEVRMSGDMLPTAAMTSSSKCYICVILPNHILWNVAP